MIFRFFEMENKTIYFNVLVFTQNKSFVLCSPERLNQQRSTFDRFITDDEVNVVYKQWLKNTLHLKNIMSVCTLHNTDVLLHFSSDQYCKYSLKFDPIPKPSSRNPIRWLQNNWPQVSWHQSMRRASRACVLFRAPRLIC